MRLCTWAARGPYTVEGLQPEASGPLAGGRLPLEADLSLPAYGTALQEQLGLKLERTSGSVDVIVIAAIEPPLPD